MIFLVLNAMVCNYMMEMILGWQMTLLETALHVHESGKLDEGGFEIVHCRFKYFESKVLARNASDMLPLHCNAHLLPSIQLPLSILSLLGEPSADMERQL